MLLLDSIGELASLYRIADGAFVGGSLVPSGGHNILEPAAFGKVPVFGPSMENFAEIASRFVSAGAAIQVRDAAELTDVVRRLLSDTNERAHLGETARALVLRQQGATDRTIELLDRLLLNPARGQAA